MIFDFLRVFGDFGRRNIPPDLRSSDLPSKRLLGKGLASIGYETEWKGVRYARKDFVAVPSDIFRQEAGVLLHLPDHENVVKTHGLTVDKLSCSLILDYMDDKLTDLLQKRKDLHERSPAGEHDPTLQESLGMILEIARAVEHLHKHGILHGDLKSRNVLVTYMNDGDKSLLVKSVKVADFGLVQTKRNSMPYVSNQVRKLDMVRWKAPENLMELFCEAKVSPDPKSSDSDEDFTGSARVTQSDDAYCFGLTCFQILTGEEPYPKRNWKELVIDIVSNKRGLKLPPNLSCPQDLRELVDECCDASPHKRPTFFCIREKLEDIHSLQPWIVKEERKRLEKDFNELELNDVVESVEFIQVSEGLRIIEDVNRFSGNFLMNKHQCKRLANRLNAIGEQLKELREELFNKGANGTDQMTHPPFDFLLIILGKARALLSKYLEWRTSMVSVLARREDREAFKEIHVDLDMLKLQFDFQDVISEIEKVAMLTLDADTDSRELDESLHDSAHGDDYKKAVESVKMMIFEKRYGTSTSDDALPSYLSIDLANVEIRNPVRIPQRLSNHDPAHTLDWALVRIGTYLGCEVALKVFKSGDTTWNRRELVKEVRSLKELCHPHVVQILGFGQDDERCIILMELMDTDLRYFMNKHRSPDRRPFTRVQELDIISQIAKGMYYVHEQQYVHGELKCSNILVKQLGEHIDVKIADFRSSQKLGVWDPVEFKERGSRRRPRWTAPEVRQYGESLEPTHELLKKTDVYSFGMVCFEVVTGKLPFQDVRGKALERLLAIGELKQDLPGELDGNLRALIESCWERDPDLRPTFEAICHRLDHIRSSQFALSKWHSADSTVMHRLIPLDLRPGGRDQLMDPPEISSWEHIVEQQVDMDLVEPVSVASPQFVRTDPGNLKKGTSRGHTHLECTQEEGEGEGEDDADEESEGELDRAKVGDSLFPSFVRIDPAQLKLEGVIGKGSFADVYAATWLGCRYAVKRLKAIQPRDVEKELKFLIELRHPCLVRMMGASVRSDRGCSIVMELMGGDLRNLINSRMRRRPLAEPVFSMQTVMTAAFRNNLQTRAIAFHPHKRNRSRNQTKCLSRKRCRTLKPALKAMRPDLQPHSDSRERNRMLDEVLEGAEKLQQHMDSRKPKEMKRPAEPHSDVVPFDPHEAVYIIKRIALGMAFLHSRGIVHRDLKAPNILVPEHPGSVDVKITDFGVAEIFNSNKKLSLGVGTGFWVAPEMFRSRPSGENQGMSGFDLKAADVYSFAMTCYEVLTGKLPMEDEIELFSHGQELKLAVVGGLRPRLPPDVNPDMDQLIRECWDKNPEKRPTFSTICTRLQKIQQRLPIPQVFDALAIIGYVTEISSKFLINKHQCERLAARYGAIGEKLKDALKEFVGASAESDSNKVEYPAFDYLLTVLKKGKVLLSKYIESEASISSVLTRTENREAFEEIHADLDIMNALFQFESFEHISERMRSVVLTQDAEYDLREMSESLDELAPVFKIHGEDVKSVVSAKSNTTKDDELLSYLTINPAAVEVHDPVRNPERKSKHDPMDRDGWVLVHKGSWLGCKCAVKIFKSKDPTWNRNELLKEVCSLRNLHHPHVVQLMGFAQDDEQCLLLMELMDTDLRHFMNQRCSPEQRPFSRVQELDIITQIAKGMYYLHEQGYVHGELKCSNILVKQIGGYIDVKISDLRSSQKLQDAWDPVLVRERGLRRPRWTAPEVHRYGESLELPTPELLKKTDVYSFGMVCFEVVTGMLPFQDIFDDELKRRIATGELKQELPGELDPKLRGLIESCWERDPSERPSFETICHVLNDIRASQLAVATKSSGKEYVQRLFRLIPSLLGQFGDREERSGTSSTWGISHVEADESMEVDTVSDVALPEFVRIDPRDLKMVRLIGEGSVAKVYEATWLGCRYAVKTFKSESPVSVQQEVNFLVELRHPSIVRLMGLAVHSDSQCSIVMEYMGCNLRQLIESRKRKRKLGSHSVPFEFLETVLIITKIALGMAFLHSWGVTHRDLKAENILVPEHSGSIDVKITDFGVSELIDSAQKPSLGVGTAFWRAPEVFPRPSVAGDLQPAMIGYDLKAADVYSFAMTCYEVVTGAVPLEEVKGLGFLEGRSKVIAGLRPTLPSDLNSDLKLLIEECWDGKPEKRPTFSSICAGLQKIQQELQNSACNLIG